MIILFVFSLQTNIQKSITLWARVAHTRAPKEISFLFYLYYYSCYHNNPSLLSYTEWVVMITFRESCLVILTTYA